MEEENLTILFTLEQAERLLTVLADMWAYQRDVDTGQWSILPELIEVVEDAITQHALEA